MRLILVHTPAAGVRGCRCRSVRFDWDGRPLRIDDTAPEPGAGRSGAVEITLDPAALAVLTPGEA